MTASPSTTIDLIRHGEPVGGHKYRGQTDDPLSEKGWQQMRAAVADHRPWDAIVSSPLARCAAFARELSARHDLPLEIEPRLREIGFGIWEGHTAAEIMQSDSGAIARFWRDPVRHTPPGAEPLANFRERVSAAWSDLQTRHARRHVLVVCHGGVIRMAISQVLNMPLENLFRIQVPNASITRIRIDGEGEAALPNLVFHSANL
jgi:alpha-ribazole phosphatase